MIPALSIRTTSAIIYLSTAARICSSSAFSTIGSTNQISLTSCFNKLHTQQHRQQTMAPVRQNVSFNFHSPSSVAMAITSSKNAITMSKNAGNSVSIYDLTYREMQKICKERGLAAKGTTDAMRTRLLNDDMRLSTPMDTTITNLPGAYKKLDFSETEPKKTSSSTRTKSSRSPKPLPTTPDAKEVITTTRPPTVKAKSRNDQSMVTPTKRKKPPKPRTTSSSRKRQRIEPGSLTPPNNWESIYSLVEELRADRTAPLDTDGGEALPERHLGEKVYRFQVLVALMLSSQTKDAVVGNAMRTMQKHGLTVENIHATDSIILNGLINKVGFHNNKTKFLKQAVEVLIREYDGDIPPNADEIMKLSGVGPKMAYIVEQIVYNKSTGIGVDTHMHRLFNDLKWVTSKTPEQTREQLEGWLPRDKWGKVNMIWVGFGQESQQQKEKILKKALVCSQPIQALGLLKKVGLDLKKEGKKYGLEDDIKKAYNKGQE